MKQHIFIWITALVLSACGNSNPSESKSTETETPQFTELNLDNIKLKIPQGWEKVPPSSSMRIAQLNLQADPSVQLAVFFFGPQDMKQENIDRWKEQFTEITSFSEPQSSKPEVSAVKILGTFKKKARPMADDFTETPGYGTLAAIIPTKSGPYYLKLTAPEAIINQQESAFVGMLNSFTVSE